MADRVLPSKLVDERITVRFNFTDELEWGETIMDADFSIQVLSGVDTTPQLMLTGGVTILGTYVSHKIWRGLPGVIYQVVVTAVGSTGNLYQKVAKLAILPSDAITPPLAATFYTSRIYPIDVVDNITSAAFIDEGFEGGLISDGVRSSVVIVSGSLLVILVSYVSPPEGIASAVDIVTGNLYTGLKTYTIPPEGINSSVTILSGELLIILVQTTMVPEGINSSASILSGTLT